MADGIIVQPYPDAAPPPPAVAPPIFGNLDAADAELKLTPQERALYERHLGNLYGPGGVDNPPDADSPAGSRSSLYQMSFERGGKTYNVPTVYDGKKLTPDEAVARAERQGLDKFPSYASEKEAEDRYQAMHQFMDRDTGRFLALRSQLRANAATQALATGAGTGVTY